MRYKSLPSTFYQNNRKKITAKLKPKSMLVLASNDVMPTNADGTMGFRQQSDLFWLTGIDQEETFLLLFPDAPEEKFKEILFVRKTNESLLIWEGQKFTKPEATGISGIQHVEWSSEFWRIVHQLVGECELVYLYANEHARNHNEVETANDKLIKTFKVNYPLVHLDRIYPITRKLRMIKDDEEISQIKKACEITRDGFLRLLKTTKPGVMEYQLEAELIHEFKSQGSMGFAYQPIIAGGENSCVLHYIRNDRPLKEGDVLLLDIGAEYGNYNADLTRTIPVGGKFTERQKKVYQAVLNVQKEAINLLRPGNNWLDYHKQVGLIMEKELIGLGLLNEDEVKNQDPADPLYKKYFMHGTSHHLGIDVHDVMDMYASFEPGMVFTCEPGIYIREEGIGIRIENNIVVTKDEPLDLMADIPREVEEIEALMNG